MKDDGTIIHAGEHRIYLYKQHVEPLLLPVINLPFRTSLQGLTLLWNPVEICSQHNSMLRFLLLEYSSSNEFVLSDTCRLKGGAPVMVLYGEPDVGKTTIAYAAISVLGIEACTFRGTKREYFIHLASQTLLGLIYDDSSKVQ